MEQGKNFRSTEFLFVLGVKPYHHETRRVFQSSQEPCRQNDSTHADLVDVRGNNRTFGVDFCFRLARKDPRPVAKRIAPQKPADKPAPTFPRDLQDVALIVLHANFGSMGLALQSSEDNPVVHSSGMSC